MYLEFPVTDQEILTSENFVSDAVEIFILMKEFNQFLNKALRDFKLPERK